MGKGGFAYHLEGVAPSTGCGGESRALNVRSDVLAGVAEDGEVTVEGEVVGHLDGVCFTIDAGGSALADRALRQAATREAERTAVRKRGESLLAIVPEESNRLTVRERRKEGGEGKAWRVGSRSEVVSPVSFRPFSQSALGNVVDVERLAGSWLQNALR